LLIRPFDGTLHDAKAIIEADGETFDDCNYTPEYIVDLVADPRQRVWVAVDDNQIVGFVSAFDTHSLAGDRWEIDELAVRPAFQGRGVGTRLIAQVTGEEPSSASLQQDRALIAAHNAASRRAFEKNGFRPIVGVDLLLYQVSGRVPRPRAADSPDVRQARIEDAGAIAKVAGHSASSMRSLIQRHENVYLIAEQGESCLGYAELVDVRTLQYQGFWIESLALRVADRRAAKALFSAAIEQAKRRPEMDRVGYLARPEDELLYTACVSEGFQKIDDYQIYVKERR
jgi:GNAT superfamily N-acetyltransferase